MTHRESDFVQVLLRTGKIVIYLLTREKEHLHCLQVACYLIASTDLDDDPRLIITDLTVADSAVVFISGDQPLFISKQDHSPFQFYEFPQAPVWSMSTTLTDSLLFVDGEVRKISSCMLLHHLIAS